MEVLSKWTSVEDFPLVPRRVRLRPSFWIVIGSILAGIGIAIAVASSLTEQKILNATLLYESAERATARIRSKGTESSHKNPRYYVQYEAIEDRSVFGKAYVRLEKWDQYEVGQKIPVWYLFNDHSVNSIVQPSKKAIFSAKESKLLTILGLIAVGAIALLVQAVFVCREWKLAMHGIPTLGEYRLETKSAAGRTEYRCIWSYRTPQGKRRTQMNSQVSPTRLPKIGEGNVTLLVDAKHSGQFRAWELFRWVDIKTN